MKRDIETIDVIAPNFKKRMSGVTSTVFRLVPLQAKMIGIASCGPNIPDTVPQISLMDILTMSRRPRVWHARRNNEMIAGLALKYLLGKRLKLVFTSAAQRDHKSFTKWLIRQMDHVVATSTKSAAYLDVPCDVIHHGIDAEVFAPVLDKFRLRADLGLPPDDLLIGCYGRVRSQKGNDLFVDTMIAVLPEFPKATAVMMGGVTDEHKAFADDLRARIATAGLTDRILILPEDPHWNIARWFQVLDLYIAPQRWEGFGLTPLEAMACAVPVIATRVGAFEELIADGQTGILVDIEDTDHMVHATRDLLDDHAKRTSWSQNARTRVEASFRIEKEASALIAIYRRLLD